MKPHKRREEFYRSELPYGERIYTNGVKELFNRRYQVIAAKGGIPSGDWEDHWFYDDTNPPWTSPKTKARCEAILREWDKS